MGFPGGCSFNRTPTRVRTTHTLYQPFGIPLLLCDSLESKLPERRGVLFSRHNKPANARWLRCALHRLSSTNLVNVEETADLQLQHEK